MASLHKMCCVVINRNFSADQPCPEKWNIYHHGLLIRSFEYPTMVREDLSVSFMQNSPSLGVTACLNLHHLLLRPFQQLDTSVVKATEFGSITVRIAVKGSGSVRKTLNATVLTQIGVTGAKLVDKVHIKYW